MLKLHSATSKNRVLSGHRFLLKKRVLSARPYLLMLLLDLVALAASLLASHSTAFANAYAHHVYRFLSLALGSVMGLVPFSVAELLLYGLVLFLLYDFLRALYKSFHAGLQLVHSHASPCPAAQVTDERTCPHGFKASSAGSGRGLSSFRRLSPLLRPFSSFFSHVFLILSVLFVLYVFLCGINYHRTSFSEEAGLSVEIGTNADTGAEDEADINTDAEAEMGMHTDTANGMNADVKVDQKEELLALCRYLVTEINEQEASFEASGACIGETQDSPKPSMAWLFQAGHAGQRAMEKLGARYPRLAGHYPFPKPVLNTWILSVQQTTGVYSPFTVEANYNRDIPYYDLPFTICHELSHLRGYMQEEEANFIAVLATIGADDAYYNYSGYVSAWVYAGNALARVDSDAFATLYGALNARTRQDLLYNNQYWQQFEGKPAETHEKVNDAYLKAQGQTAGTASYGHVTDLMLAYFAEHGTLR